MDLIRKSIQRGFTSKCVAEVREDLETHKKQISNPVTVDTSKVLYEEICLKKSSASTLILL